MDFLNKLLAQLNDVFKTMSPGARITSVLLLVAVVVSLGYLFNAQTGGGEALLLNGQSFTADEMSAMEAAFGKAGLGDYTVDGSRIRVAKSRQAAYLGALADAGALPARFGDHLTKAVDGGGPFVGRAQQEEMLKVAKQKELAQIIRSMQGIESAAVLFDIQKKSGFRQETSVTASVSVKPRGTLNLDEKQVPMIRSLVAGSIAGLQPENVTVVDVNGRSYSGKGGSSAGSALDDPYLTRIREYQDVYEQRIRNQLAHIPGVSVTANVELDRELLKHIEEHKVDPKTVAINSKIDETTRTSNSTQGAGGRPGLAQQQPNAPASLPAGAGGGSSTEETVTKTETANAANHGRTVTEMAGLTPRRVSVSIGVPTTYFEKIWEQRNPAAPGEEKKKPDAAALTAIQDEELKNIRAAVAQLIPLPTDSATPVDPATLVNVTTFSPVALDAPVGPSVVDRGLEWLAESWNTLAMIALAAFSLMMLKSFVRGIPASAPASVSSTTIPADDQESQIEGSETKGAAGKPKQRSLQRKLGSGPSLREELIDMVREDPDAAANVLRGWIGNVT